MNFLNWKGFSKEHQLENVLFITLWLIQFSISNKTKKEIVRPPSNWMFGMNLWVLYLDLGTSEMSSHFMSVHFKYFYNLVYSLKILNNFNPFQYLVWSVVHYCDPCKPLPDQCQNIKHPGVFYYLLQLLFYLKKNFISIFTHNSIKSLIKCRMKIDDFYK